MNNPIIAITVLNKIYRVTCPPEETQQLRQSAEQLNKEIRQLMQKTQVSKTESLAVITALNLCNEKMQLKSELNQCIDTTQRRVRNLRKKIENFLATEQEFAL